MRSSWLEIVVATLATPCTGNTTVQGVADCVYEINKTNGYIRDSLINRVFCSGIKCCWLKGKPLRLFAIGATPVERLPNGVPWAVAPVVGTEGGGTIPKVVA